MTTAAPWFTASTGFRIVGLSMVIVGSWVSGRFIWSVPTLVQSMKDEAPAGHAGLVLFGAFIPALLAVAGVILVWLGLRLLRSRGMRWAARGGALG